MPKKFKGENSKAAEARTRKEIQKQAETEQKDREKEDELWKDDDKHVARKQQRKDEKEKKKQEQFEKKQQLKQLYDEEMAQVKVTKTTGASKVTRAEVEANREKLAAAAAAESKGDLPQSHDEVPLEENVNRLDPEGEEARTVEEAISMLSTKEPELDKHPEKRVKAAYLKYEADNLPILKQENPNMRLSQLKQLLKKDWMKSPENPLNQRHIAFNTK